MTWEPHQQKEIIYQQHSELKDEYFEENTLYWLYDKRGIHNYVSSFEYIRIVRLELVRVFINEITSVLRSKK